MAITLTPKGQVLLDMQMADLRRSETVRRLQQALANELERIEAFVIALRMAAFPHLASDAAGTLAIWEHTLGLPVKPAGSTEDQRRAAVSARFRARTQRSGADWVAAANEMIGPGWTHLENFPGPNQITVRIPFLGGSQQAGLVEDFLREITPAAEELIVTYGEGFLVGISEVGEGAI